MELVTVNHTGLPSTRLKCIVTTQWDVSSHCFFPLLLNKELQGTEASPFNVGTIKEILGTAQSVGCNVDGRHPHDIIDDINSGAVECPAVSDIAFFPLFC